MSKRRVIDDALYAHFVTFSVDRRRNLLALDHPKRIVLGVLNEQLTIEQARCIGFVVMPNHVHGLIWFPHTGRLSHFMHGWKRKSSYALRHWYRENAPNYSAIHGEDRRFWTPKYHAFEIYTQPKLHEKLTYLHLNPVRAGLVSRTIDYPWSSARWYEQRRSVGVPIEWVA